MNDSAFQSRTSGIGVALPNAVRNHVQQTEGEFISVFLSQGFKECPTSKLVVEVVHLESDIKKRLIRAIRGESMIDYVVLLIGIASAAGLLWVLSSALISGGESEHAKRVGALLIVLAYVVSELIPSRFFAVTPATDLVSSVLTLASIILGLVLLFGQSILSRWS